MSNEKSSREVLKQIRITKMYYILKKKKFSPEQENTLLHYGLWDLSESVSQRRICRQDMVYRGIGTLVH